MYWAWHQILIVISRVFELSINTVKEPEPVDTVNV